MGMVFIISAAEKLLSPRENFLYVIQNYQVLPFPFLEEATSYVFPWLELAIGGFLVLGLWTPWSLAGAGLCSFTFMIIVGQAMIRQLPIQECGCFGELLKVPLPVTFSIDTTMLWAVFIMWRRMKKTTSWSLDRYLAK